MFRFAFGRFDADEPRALRDADLGDERWMAAARRADHTVDDHLFRIDLPGFVALEYQSLLATVRRESSVD